MSPRPPLLPDDAVADLLIVLGAIARIAAEPAPGLVELREGLEACHEKLYSIRLALKNIGVVDGQRPIDRLTAIKTALKRL